MVLVFIPLKVFCLSAYTLDVGSAFSITNFVSRKHLRPVHTVENEGLSMVLILYPFKTFYPVRKLDAVYGADFVSV